MGGRGRDLAAPFKVCVSLHLTSSLSVGGAAHGLTTPLDFPLDIFLGGEQTCKHGKRASGGDFLGRLSVKL